jgi:hypothetical protein
MQYHYYTFSISKEMQSSTSAAADEGAVVFLPMASSLLMGDEHNEHVEEEEEEVGGVLLVLVLVVGATNDELFKSGRVFDFTSLIERWWWWLAVFASVAVEAPDEGSVTLLLVDGSVDGDGDNGRSRSSLVVGGAAAAGGLSMGTGGSSCWITSFRCCNPPFGSEITVGMSVSYISTE